MSQPSILIVTNRVPYPLNDGGNLAMYSIIKGYHIGGWKVFLLSMNTSRHFIDLESLPQLFHEIKMETFEINTDVKTIDVLINLLLSRKPNHAERFYSKQFEQKMAKIILEFQPSVVQLESIYLATYIDSIRAISNCKIAVRLHNIEHQIWDGLANEMKIGLKKIYLQNLAARIKKFELAAWQKADILIPITFQDANIVKNQLPLINQLVVPYGVCTEQFDKTIENVGWNGYHIGAMDWVPNAEAIVWFIEKVWPSLHEEMPNFKFYFAGRNMPDFFHKYKGDGIYCLGEVADAKNFIADKKMLIVPLRSGGGIRVKVLEAMAAGKLIVATKIAMEGINEVKENVHYLEANTATEFKTQIVFALKNKSQASMIADNGKCLVNEFYDEVKIMKSLCEFMQKQINT